MTSELREKIEEISRLSEINLKFKEKLKDFQQQNEENVRVFQEETLNQSIKYRNLLESNKALQEEQAKNSEKINELLLKNYSLNKAQMNTQDSALKVFNLIFNFSGFLMFFLIKSWKFSKKSLKINRKMMKKWSIL